MRTNRLVLLSLTAAATATLVACTECAETDTDQSVTGALTYTESAAAQAARERRIVDLPKNVTVWERTDDTKVGIARQVDMRDTFSVYVSHYSAAGNMCVQGANLRGSLCFDQPTRDGTFSLASLKAKVCENYRVRVGFAEANDAGTPDAPKIGDAGDAGDAGKSRDPYGDDYDPYADSPYEHEPQSKEACGVAEGTLRYVRTDDGFSADLTLTGGATAASADPQLRGTAHLSFSETTTTHVCPDMGGMSFNPMNH